MILNILHILNILKVFLQKRDPQLNCLWALFQARRCEVWKAGKVSEDYLRFFVGNPGIDNSHLGIVNMASGDSHMIIQYSFMISSLYPYDIPRKYHDISTNLSLKIWSGPQVSWTTQPLRQHPSCCPKIGCTGSRWEPGIGTGNQDDLGDFSAKNMEHCLLNQEWETV
jgi:hypothetical protein